MTPVEKGGGGGGGSAGRGGGWAGGGGPAVLDEGFGGLGTCGKGRDLRRGRGGGGGRGVGDLRVDGEASRGDPWR